MFFLALQPSLTYTRSPQSKLRGHACLFFRFFSSFSRPSPSSLRRTITPPASSDRSTRVKRQSIVGGRHWQRLPFFHAYADVTHTFRGDVSGGGYRGPSAHVVRLNLLCWFERRSPRFLRALTQGSIARPELRIKFPFLERSTRKSQVHISRKILWDRGRIATAEITKKRFKAIQCWENNKSHIETGSNKLFY